MPSYVLFKLQLCGPPMFPLTTMLNAVGFRKWTSASQDMMLVGTLWCFCEFLVHPGTPLAGYCLIMQHTSDPSKLLSAAILFACGCLVVLRGISGWSFVPQCPMTQKYCVLMLHKPFWAGRFGVQGVL